MAYNYSSESEDTQELRRQRGRAISYRRELLFGRDPSPVSPPFQGPAASVQPRVSPPRRQSRATAPPHTRRQPAAANFAGMANWTNNMDIGYDNFDIDHFFNSVGIGAPQMAPAMAPGTLHTQPQPQPPPAAPPPPPIPTGVGVGSAPVQAPTASTGVGVGTRGPTTPPGPPPPSPVAASTPLTGHRAPTGRRRQRGRLRGRRRATNTVTRTRTRARRTGANAFPSDSSHGSDSSSSSSNTPARGNRLNQAEIRRQLQRLSNDQIQAARGRRIAGVTTTNTITTTYKDGGTPTVSRTSSSSRS